MKKPILIWDIDGTLSEGNGAGLQALSSAIEQHFPGAKDPVLDLAGATDGGIYRIMCERYEQPYSPAGEQQFYELYLPTLERNLSSGEYDGVALPTVQDTLDHFRAQGFTQGLLTGNVEKGAYLKNQSFGLESYFSFGAYGCDHWDRNELGFIAAQRAGEFLSQDVSPADLLVIGDTPKDIACARACGARVAAVTTGQFQADQLQEADWVISAAEELKEIVKSILN